MGKSVDLTGYKYGSNEVISRYTGDKEGDGHLRYLVRCSCGYERLLRSNIIKRGKSTHCMYCHNRKPRKHGLSKTKIMGVWNTMLSRCFNSNHKNYDTYGGAGITVCDEWKKPASFFEWALANGYQEGLQIDRFPNRHGNYEPSNCRWVTCTENARNKDCVTPIETVKQIKSLKGIMSAAKCAKQFSVSSGVVYHIWRNETFKEI